MQDVFRSFPFRSVPFEHVVGEMPTHLSHMPFRTVSFLFFQGQDMGLVLICVPEHTVDATFHPGPHVAGAVIGPWQRSVFFPFLSSLPEKDFGSGALTVWRLAAN